MGNWRFLVYLSAICILVNVILKLSHFKDRIEEAACKRIADLEAELQRVAQSEKRSISRAAELEQQFQQHQLLLQASSLARPVFNPSILFVLISIIFTGSRFRKI